MRPPRTLIFFEIFRYLDVFQKNSLPYPQSAHEIWIILCKVNVTSPNHHMLTDLSFLSLAILV